MNILILKYPYVDYWYGKALTPLLSSLIDQKKHNFSSYLYGDQSSKQQIGAFKNHLECAAIDKIILIPKDNDWENPTFSLFQRRVCNLFTTEQEICYTIYTKKDGNTHIYQLDTDIKSPIIGTRDSIFKEETSLPTFISQTIIYETE